MDNNKDFTESTSENSKNTETIVNEEIIEHIDDKVVNPQVITFPNIVEQPICEIGMD